MYRGIGKRQIASLLVFLLVCEILLPLTALAATETRVLGTLGPGTWVAPPGVTTVKVEVWAGGGGGGGTAASGNGGGGGAGGGYAQKTSFVTTPGNTYNFYIGKGGTGGTGTVNGGKGDDSSFNASSTLLAVGGPGGASLANGSAGGATTTGSTAIGDVIRHGGNGGNGTGTSGGGGGGAGDTTNGVKGTNGGAGGAGGTTGGGQGGAGVSGNAVGNPGASLSGGGSGADSNNTTARKGGDGAAGQLKLTYTIFTILADTTDPGNTTLSGGGAATMADAFTFQTSTTTDVVSAVVVSLGAGASGGISLVEITDSAGSTVYGSVNPAGNDSPSVTLSTNTLTANTAATTYKIRITPKSVVTGGPYTVTAKISSYTSTNVQSGSDTAGTTITINNGGGSAPTVTTNSITPQVTSAPLSGTVSNNGGIDATTAGFAWGTNSALSGGNTATSSQTGTFTTGANFGQTVSGLISGVTYYYRAFATNSVGTGLAANTGGGCTNGICSFTAGSNTIPSRNLRLFEGFVIRVWGGTARLYSQ